MFLYSVDGINITDLLASDASHSRSRDLEANGAMGVIVGESHWTPHTGDDEAAKAGRAPDERLHKLRGDTRECRYGMAADAVASRLIDIIKAENARGGIPVVLLEVPGIPQVGLLAKDVHITFWGATHNSSGVPEVQCVGVVARLRQLIHETRASATVENAEIGITDDTIAGLIQYDAFVVATRIILAYNPRTSTVDAALEGWEQSTNAESVRDLFGPSYGMVREALLRILRGKWPLIGKGQSLKEIARELTAQSESLLDRLDGDRNQAMKHNFLSCLESARSKEEGRPRVQCILVVGFEHLQNS